MSEQKEKLNEVEEKEVAGGKTIEIATLIKVPYCSVCNCISTPENPITHYGYLTRSMDQSDFRVNYRDKKYLCDKCYEEPKNRSSLTECR